MSDIETKELKEPIDVATYLFTRLHQMGIRSIHGVPGDYNLLALDYIPDNGLNFVGNANELNAGYAADGYARVNGMGAVISAFGVGELSLINAIAGAYSEFVPVVNIIGQPSTVSQANGMLVHHTLGNGDFTVFARMAREVSCYSAHLTDPHQIATQIDSALRECYIKSRPVYLTLPTDVVQKKVEGSRLSNYIDLSLPPNKPEAEDYVVEVVLRYIQAAKKPVILVDACTSRFHCEGEVHALVKKSGFPTFVAPMGKGIVDETLPNYGGVYAGDGSLKEVKAEIENSDLVLSIGGIKSDFNTTGFTYRTTTMNTIDFHSNRISIRYSDYPTVGMKGVLRKVNEKLQSPTVHWQSKLANIVPVDKRASTSPIISHAWLWPTVGKWLRENDIVLTETGTANFGIWETRFPHGVQNIAQVLWGSIGYTVGATQGAALAAKETQLAKNIKRRTILFIGDGSMQLSVQEISTMLRNKLKPIIFVICNNGYTIERYIHGFEASYNDIQQWKFQDIPATFGAPKGSYRTYSVDTTAKFESLCMDEKFNQADVLQLVEVHMPRDDCPTPLKLTAEASSTVNERIQA